MSDQPEDFTQFDQAPKESEWPWPHFPKGQTRNHYRRASEVFTGWEGDFLYGLMNSGVVRAALEHAHISHATVQSARRRDPRFVEACNEAMDLAIDLAEAALQLRAVKGQQRTEVVEEYMPDGKGQGGQILKSRRTKNITEYSDTLLMFLLKARRPNVYRDAVDVNHRMRVMRAEAEKIALAEGLDVDELMAEIHAMSEGK